MREKKKNTPFLKKSPGEKSNTPLFLQFSGRTLSHENYPFTGHFGNTHAVIPTSEWGGWELLSFVNSVCCHGWQPVKTNSFNKIMEIQALL